MTEKCTAISFSSDDVYGLGRTSSSAAGREGSREHASAFYPIIRKRTAMCSCEGLCCGHCNCVRASKDAINKSVQYDHLVVKPDRIKSFPKLQQTFVARFHEENCVLR